MNRRKPQRVDTHAVSVWSLGCSEWINASRIISVSRPGSRNSLPIQFSIEKDYLAARNLPFHFRFGSRPRWTFFVSLIFAIFRPKSIACNGNGGRNGVAVNSIVVVVVNNRNNNKNVNDIKSNHKLFTGLRLFLFPPFLFLFSFSSFTWLWVELPHRTLQTNSLASPSQFQCSQRQHNAFGSHINVFTQWIPDRTENLNSIFNLVFLAGRFVRWGSRCRCQSTRFLYSGFRIFFFAPRGRRCCVDGVFMLWLAVPGPISARKAQRERQTDATLGTFITCALLLLLG